MTNTTSRMEASDWDPIRRLTLRRIGLTVISGADEGIREEFDADIVRIGSDPGNHFVLSDSTVSRRHAEIARTAQGMVLRDLDSRNGTFVGETMIREVYLMPGRRFRVGATEIELEVVDEVIDIVPTQQTSFENIVGVSRGMREIFTMIDRVARTGLTVLVTGETGTGKELVSRALHQRSARRNGPFVVFDCGAVARNLIESELFGHERGAFTGAIASRPGVFEQAHGGTIVLDELGELPLDLQPTLLRVLEQREVRRVGDRTLRPVDVRVVAATNRDLQALIKEKSFREDLYYRLAVVEIPLPPLRDRLEDLPVLVDHLLRTGTPGPSGRPVRGVAPDVLQLFASYHWPGNVRELRNILLRAVPFCAGELVDMPALPESLRSDGQRALSDAPPGRSPEDGSAFPLPSGDLSLREAKVALIEAFERRYLQELLERSGGNLSEAARRAGVDRKTIARILKKHQLRFLPST